MSYKGKQIREEIKHLEKVVFSRDGEEIAKLVEFLSRRGIRRHPGVSGIQFTNPFTGRYQGARHCLRLAKRMVIGTSSRPIHQMMNAFVEAIQSEDIDKVRKAAEPILLLFGHEL